MDTYTVTTQTCNEIERFFISGVKAHTTHISRVAYLQSKYVCNTYGHLIKTHSHYLNSNYVCKCMYHGEN